MVRDSLQPYALPRVPSDAKVIPNSTGVEVDHDVQGVHGDNDNLNPPYLRQESDVVLPNASIVRSPAVVEAQGRLEERE